jgi:hypothetical protein
MVFVTVCVLVYLTMLFQLYKLVSNGMTILNNELGRIWKEVGMTYFKVQYYPSICLGRTGQKLNEDSQPLHTQNQTSWIQSFKNNHSVVTLGGVCNEFGLDYNELIFLVGLYIQYYLVESALRVYHKINAHRLFSRMFPSQKTSASISCFQLGAECFILSTKR